MKRIIFFDGVCPVCNGFVDYVLKKDSKNYFQFSSLQSEFTKSHLDPQHQSLDTVILMENEQVYLKSTAVLRILLQLGGHWTALAIFASVIPRVIRDMIYDLVAKNRYRVFGKYETCRMPTAEEKARFIL